MDSARYSCSSAITRARWGGKVILLIEGFRAAIAWVDGWMPNDEPIRKQAADLPPVFTPCSAEASSSEESSLPSGVSTQSHAPFGMVLRMDSASRARPCAI